MDDRSEAEDVRRRFGAALDDRDWTAFAALFTDRVAVDLPAFGVAGADLSRQEVVDLFRHSFRRPAPDNPTQQLYGNVRAEIRGDEATCTSYLLGHHLLDREEAVVRGRYDDRLVRDAAGGLADRRDGPAPVLHHGQRCGARLGAALPTIRGRCEASSTTGWRSGRWSAR